jgi:hypothetical protein
MKAERRAIRFAFDFLSFPGSAGNEEGRRKREHAWEE